jgi:hypothetical protein
MAPRLVLRRSLAVVAALALPALVALPVGPHRSTPAVATTLPDTTIPPTTLCATVTVHVTEPPPEVTVCP